MTRAVLAGALLVLATACGGDDDGYDAEYDCTQSFACAEERGLTTRGTLEQCIRNSGALYDVQPEADRERADTLFQGCASLTSCAYVDCVLDAIDP